MTHGGVQVIFSVLEAFEVKLPALRAFVPPTHFVEWVGEPDYWKTNYVGGNPTFSNEILTLRLGV